MIKKFLKEYFSFSRREQHGILILSSLIVILILVNLLIAWLPVKRLHNAGEIREIMEDFDRINESNQNRTDGIEERDEQAVHTAPRELFYFDPNQTSRQDLMKLGLDEKVTTTWLHYLDKGGRFYEKKDLLKIYGMDTSVYYELEPFIRIAPIIRRDNPDYRESIEESVNRIIELNKADTVDLLPLKGIGPVLARRVVKYRDILGGFVTRDQLLEVYGISEEVFREIYPHIQVDSTLIKKLDLNHATYADFIRHPYFNRELTNAILNYRKKQGTIRSVSEFRKEEITTEEEYQKIFPYLTLGERDE
jgi:competence protein ComEA